MTAFDTFLRTRTPHMLEVADGVATPRVFTNARTEHLATRGAAGLFDFSFMCSIELSGPQSLDFLHALQTRSLRNLARGRIAYALILRDDGSVLNDATVWRFDEAHWRLFVGRRSDFVHIADTARAHDVRLEDISSRHAVIALQGPASAHVVERCFGTATPKLAYYEYAPLRFDGSDCWIARLGYSGETGYELIVNDAAGAKLWQALLDAGRGHGVTECGFDAIDSLRIEAGHILFARELASPVTPYELGLGRLVDIRAHDFRGAQALRNKRSPFRRIAGLLPSVSAVVTTELPTQIDEGTAILTSAAFSPVFGRTLGIGFVNAADAYAGTRVRLQDGSAAHVTRLPFYDPGKILPRAR